MPRRPALAPELKAARRAIREAERRLARLAELEALEADRTGRSLSRYQRRLLRALRAGKSVQEARGHRPREHVGRRERELREKGITSSQQQAMKRYVQERYQDWDEWQEFFEGKGWTWFVRLRDLRRQLHRTWLKGGQTRIFSGLADFEAWLKDRMQDREVEPWMAFYH